MQSAAESIGIAQLDFDDFHAEFIHLFGLIDLGFFDADGLGSSTSTFMLSHVEE